MSRARTLQLTVSLVVGGVCLWLAFKDVDFGEAGAALGRVPWWGHVAYAASLVGQMWIRTLRWTIQVEGLAGRKPPLKDSLAINAVGFASVFLIPFRLGELVRPYLVKQRGYMSTTAGLATSAVERILDGLVTTACFALVLMLLGDRGLPREVTLGGWGALAIFGGASVVLLVGYRYRQASERFWLRTIGFVHEGLASKLVSLLSAFLDGLACFRSWGAFLAYLAYTVVFWLVNGASMWLILHLMGTGVGLLAAYFTLCFLVIGVMMPAPPGNVGNFHAFAKLGLVLLGVAEGAALAFAVVIHAWQVVTLVAWAGVFVLRGDISLARVREATHAGDEA
jgi:glycosyltransferase 2 family protein